MYCPKCGAPNSDSAVYCASCGNTLRAAPAGYVGPTGYQRKEPIIAALLNFFLFGIGYIYLGYRKIMGISTILFVILLLILYILGGLFLLGLLDLIVGLVIAYDGYVKAQGERGILGADPEYLYGRPPV
jgi:zinc-ribbon domain